MCRHDRRWKQAQGRQPDQPSEHRNTSYNSSFSAHIGSHPVPAAEKLPHSTILPSLCFTVGLALLRWWTVFGVHSHDHNLFVCLELLVENVQAALATVASLWSLDHDVLTSGLLIILQGFLVIFDDLWSSYSHLSDQVLDIQPSRRLSCCRFWGNHGCSFPF